MPLLDKLKGLFANGGANLAKELGDAFDKVFTNKEEAILAKNEAQKVINSHVERMAEIALEEMKLEVEREKAQIQDTANARDNNTKIQESDKASWMAKNIAYIIDALFVVSFMVMLCLILFKIVPESNKELFYTGFGLLGGYVGTIINFHRGTSIGSERKQKQMEKMMESKP